MEGLKTFLNENGNNQLINKDEYFKKFINYNGDKEPLKSDEICE